MVILVDQASLDAASMAAMAEFLRECEFFIDDLEGDSSTSTWTSAANRNKIKVHRRRDRYREKMKNERQILQQEERKLSRKLRQLQDAHAKAKRHEKESYTMALSVSRSTAIRQRELRAEAEERQQRLKLAVLRQQEVIRGMSALLQQCRGSSPTEAPTLHDDPVLAKSVNGASLYKIFLGELDSLYAQTSAIFESEIPKVVRGDRVDATEITFDVKQLSLAMSSIFLSGTDGIRYDGEIDDPAKTTAMTYRLKHTLESGESATLIIYTVVRRYIEEDRIVFVWRSLSEGQGEFEGLYADKHAWQVIRPSVQGRDGRITQNPVSVLESYARLKYIRLNGKAVTSRGQRFVKILTMADKEDLDDATRALLRRLVGDPIASCSEEEEIIR
ncbi:hypothetical protein ON010_g4297 [Phytophthora cinnamomi]|nr:hypothetical protein ON010_g4297 [Phytophthora cinnamomi]